MDGPFILYPIILLFVQSARICGIQGIVANISADVRISRRKSQRVFADEAADGGVVPAGAVVEQFGVGVPFSAGVGVVEGRELRVERGGVAVW